MPSEISYQIIPAALALLLSLGHLTRFRERIDVLLKYLSAGNFTYMLVEALRSGEVPPALLYTQIAFWSFSLIGSTYFTLSNAVRFVELYEHSPELIIKAITTAHWDPEPSTTRINEAGYQTLRKVLVEKDTHEKTRLMTFARKIHDQKYNSQNSLTSSQTDEYSGEYSGSFEQPRQRKPPWSCCNLL